MTRSSVLLGVMALLLLSSLATTFPCHAQTAECEVSVTATPNPVPAGQKVKIHVKITVTRPDGTTGELRGEQVEVEVTYPGGGMRRFKAKSCTGKSIKVPKSTPEGEAQSERNDRVVHVAVAEEPAVRRRAQCLPLECTGRTAVTPDAKPVPRPPRSAG